MNPASPNRWWRVAFSPDGSRLATGSYDETARIWDATNGTQLLTIQNDSRVAAVAFSPDGPRLATGSDLDAGSDDKTVRIWDIAAV